jgi:hypothetical protein
MAKPVKVLFVGDAKGDVPALWKKIQTTNNKNGPFDAVFVLGQLLGPDGSAQGLPMQAKLTVPIYLLGAG